MCVCVCVCVCLGGGCTFNKLISKQISFAIKVEDVGCDIITKVNGLWQLSSSNEEVVVYYYNLSPVDVVHGQHLHRAFLTRVHSKRSLTFNHSCTHSPIHAHVHTPTAESNTQGDSQLVRSQSLTQGHLDTRRGGCAN